MVEPTLKNMESNLSRVASNIDFTKQG